MLLDYWRTGADRPPITDPDEIARSYRRHRWTTFLAITIGYSFFYTTRLGLAVAKKPMLDAGVVGADDLGMLGLLLYVTYGFGRLTNGFLCDRAHIGRFMGTGLLLSAVLNLLFGAANVLWIFMALWTLNGWVQSMGSAPSGANIAAWFDRRVRGTRYSVWSMAHNFGEGMTFVATAAVVAAVGWRWAFWAPGITCLLVAPLLFRTILDRPQTYGLPAVADGQHDRPGRRSVGAQQLRLLRSPAIWILGCASASMYVVRYGINEWFVLYLQEAKHYDLVDAGVTTSFFPIIGAAGTLAAGPLSDRLFDGRRVPVCLAYGLLLIAGVIAIPAIPPGHPWMDATAIGVCGFAIGGLLVFLGGLIAIDVASPRAAGAAMGLIGVFSYLAAGMQNWISGVLLESSKVVSGGVIAYDFTNVLRFWLAAAVTSLVLTALLWRPRTTTR